MTEYLKAFLCGGILCAIGQILIDKTRLTPARILVMYVVVGVVLFSGVSAGPQATTPHSISARTQNKAAYFFIMSRSFMCI